MSKTTKQLYITLFSGLMSATIALSASQVSADDGSRGDEQAREQGQQDNERGNRGGGQARRGEQGERGAQLFIRLDTNEDGQLSLAELSEAAAVKAEKKFNRKDSDADGLLTLEEFSQNNRGNNQDLTAIAEEIVLCVADLKADTGNEDIIVPSVDDFTSKEDKFNVMDSSADGVLDLVEFQTAKAIAVSYSFTLMDSDESLSVSLEEFKAFKASHYATRRAICQCIDELTDDDAELI
ncbi:MAG: hypothetical protein JKY81_07320 [Colwellia sp.]|nr:hypothetical protein [Colwellia sp.]